MKCPEEVKLSREDGEALRQRLAGDTLTADRSARVGPGAPVVFLAAVCLAGGDVQPEAAPGPALWREAAHTQNHAASWCGVERR